LSGAVNAAPSHQRTSENQHTWVSEATRGLETVVTITLVPRNGGTEVTLHHANVPDHEMGRGHKEGWTWYLNTLAERFEQVGAR
jgi:uncharacterized protein YndB with AHSA1/START domain